MDVIIDEPDWEILAGMGSGAEAGLQAAGIDDFDGAVEACAVLGRAGAASGAKYQLDDLICFLCLSQHAQGSGKQPWNASICAPSLNRTRFGFGPTAEEGTTLEGP